MKIPSLKTILLGAAITIGTPLAINQCQERNRDRVASVLAHDGSVNMNDKKAFLENAPWMTEQKDIFLSIKAKHKVIEWLMQNHEIFWSDDLPDNSALDGKLRNIYQRLTQAKTAEEFRAIDQELGEVIQDLQKNTLSDKEKIQKKIQAGLDHISGWDIERTQEYIIECLQIADNEFSTPQRKIDYVLADTEEMMALIKRFSVEKDHEKASVYLRDIIAHLDKMSDSPNSPYSLVHLWEIAQKLHDRDSLWELIIKYWAVAVSLALLIIVLWLGVWQIDGYLYGQKHATGKGLIQRRKEAISAKNKELKTWWGRKRADYTEKWKKWREKKAGQAKQRKAQEEKEKVINQKQETRTRYEKKWKQESKDAEDLLTNLQKKQKAEKAVPQDDKDAIRRSRAEQKIKNSEKDITDALKKETQLREALITEMSGLKGLKETEMSELTSEEDPKHTELKEHVWKLQGHIDELAQYQGSGVLKEDVQKRHSIEREFVQIKLI